jgi:hypothetical protein
MSNSISGTGGTITDKQDGSLRNVFNTKISIKKHASPRKQPESTKNVAKLAGLNVKGFDSIKTAGV